MSGTLSAEKSRTGNMYGTLSEETKINKQIKHTKYRPSRRENFWESTRENWLGRTWQSPRSRCRGVCRCPRWPLETPRPISRTFPSTTGPNTQKKKRYRCKRFASLTIKCAAWWSLLIEALPKTRRNQTSKNRNRTQCKKSIVQEIIQLLEEIWRKGKSHQGLQQVPHWSAM